MDAYHDVMLTWMRPGQIRERREKANVAFLPLGKLEWHGVQAPVGVDSIKPLIVCCEAARKLGGGVVAPPLTYGVPRDSFDVGTCEGLDEKIAAAFGTDPNRWQGFAPFGGLDRQEQWIFYQRLLRMALDQIAGFGFRSIYICSGHAPLVHWIRPVAIAYCRMSRMAGLPVTIDWGGECDAAGIKGDHGGRQETSVTMAADESSVDLQEFERNPEYRNVGEGWDAPESSREHGEALVEQSAAAIAEEARWLVDNYPQLPERHEHKR